MTLYKENRKKLPNCQEAVLTRVIGSGHNYHHICHANYSIASVQVKMN